MEVTKRFTAKIFNGWYSDQISEELQSGTPLKDNQISEELQSGTPLKDTDVKLELSVFISLDAGWVVDFYNFITSAEGKKVTSKGWKTAGIYDTIHLGIGKLPAMDPLVNESNIRIATNLEVVCQLN